MCGGLFIWGVSDIAVNTYHVYSDKIKKPFTVAQISDAHFGLHLTKLKAQEMVILLMETDADVIVSTGDFNSFIRLVDEQIVMGLFRHFTTDKKMYAVLGGHEFHYGLRYSLEFLRQCGFTVLRNILTRISVNDNMVTIIGLEDNLPIPFHGSTDFCLALKHEPIEPEFPYDLMLAGHTHDGQGFPFVKSYYRGKYGETRKVFKGKRGRMFISPGTGTWGIPLRLFSPPEISVFKIAPMTAQDRGNPE